MNYLPIFLNLKNKPILIVGGGRVALQKIKSLTQFSQDIVVVAPSIIAAIKKFPIQFFEKEYESQYLKNIQMVFACTSNYSLNGQIIQEAHQQHILAQGVEHREDSDFISPAIFSFDNIIFAISSLGKNLKKTISYRDQLKKKLTKI